MKISKKNQNIQTMKLFRQGIRWVLRNHGSVFVYEEPLLCKFKLFSKIGIELSKIQWQKKSSFHAKFNSHHNKPMSFVCKILSSVNFDVKKESKRKLMKHEN